MNNKIKCVLKQTGFDRFVSVISDLSKVDDVVKLKIYEDEIFIYSAVGKDNMILAFKNFVLKTSDIFEKLDLAGDVLNIIIPFSKKFVKNLAFIDSKEKIDVAFTTKELSDSGYEARSIQIVNKKFKINCLTGDQIEIRDITPQLLAKITDFSNKKLSFKIDRNDFDDIKKLANINGSGLIELSSLSDGRILMSEQSAWELEVDSIEDMVNISYNVNKKFLGSINDGTESIRFHLFPNFLLVKDDESNIMVSFEQKF